MTINDLIDQWLAFREQLVALDGLKESTLNNQRQICGTLRRHFGTIEIDGLTKSAVTLFIAARLQTCAPVTVDGEIIVLRALFAFAKGEKLIAEQPTIHSCPVPNVEEPLPSDDDYTWFLRTMAPRHADPLKFMCLTGLSPHELARLQVRDRDALTGDVLIGFRPDFFVKCAARKRAVPINPTAAAIWMLWTIDRPSTDQVFPNRDALQKAMRRHAERPDAPDGAVHLSPKMMRKWFASKVAAEHSEKVLQKLLGHAPGSPVTRKHYIRSTDDELRQAVHGLS